MKMNTVGQPGKPVMIMLPGSFCRSTSMQYLYAALQNDFYILLPEYNGHYAGTTFTTREGEAREILGYLKAEGIPRVALLYGQSMGAEIALELLHQMQANGVTVGHTFLDGAPCIKLPFAVRQFMYLKFRAMVNLLRRRDADAVMKMGFLRKFANGDTESLRPMLDAMKDTAAVLTDRTIRHETACCYTFDFPAFDEATQQRMHFFYAAEEKAYRLCGAGVRQAYPQARYTVVDGCGHLTYSVKNPTQYLTLLRADADATALS